MAPDPVNVREFQLLAKEALPKMYYDFYAGGAEDEFSLKENIEAVQGQSLFPSSPATICRRRRLVATDHVG